MTERTSTTFDTTTVRTTAGPKPEQHATDLTAARQVEPDTVTAGAGIGTRTAGLPVVGRGHERGCVMTARRAPTPRPGIYELYWRFAADRQRIFQHRVAGQPPPWTDDPILATYKFCNVFRAADRVSQYLIQHICYHTEPCTPSDRLFQIVAFRTFSRIATWRGVHAFLGRHPTLDDLRDGRFSAALDHVHQRTGGLYTGAFILCATDAYGHPRTHHNHIDLMRHMFGRGALGDRLLAATSLRAVYDLLHAYPLMGDFMSYQTAIDLNYSTLLTVSEHTFTQPGPGALRGIRKCFADLGDYTPAETIMWMVDHHADEFTRLGLPFTGLWGRPLHAIDCQGLFCETDNYCREAAPELTSTRTRIKTRFTPTPEPLPLFFPPKWDLNKLVPSNPIPAPAHTQTLF